MKSFGKLLAVVLFCVALPAAAVSQDVVTAEVVLAESGEPLPEDEALEIALIQVINKISGEEYLVGDTRLKPFVEKIQTYLLDYTTNTDEERGDVLTASFDAITLSQDLGMFELVDDVVAQPSVAVLLAIEPQKGEPLRILGRRDKGIIVDVINKVAARRGLKVLLPAMDQTDRDMLSPETVLLQDHETLERVRDRYTADSYVSGLFVLDQGVWSASLESSEKPEFTAVGESKKPALALTQALLSVFESEPVVHKGTAVAQRIRIEQMQSWSDYTTTRDYLSQIPGTQSLSAVSNRGASAVFDLDLSIPVADWLKVVNEDGILRVVGPAAADSGELRFILGDRDRGLAAGEVKKEPSRVVE